MREVVTTREDRGWVVRRSRIHSLAADPFFQMAAVALLFWAAHEWFAHLVATGVARLGGIEAETAPLYAALRTDISLWIVPAVVTLLGYLLLAKLVLERVHLSVRVLLPGAILLFAWIATSVAMMDGGVGAVVEPFTRSTYEYYADVPKVESVRTFLHDYVRIHSTLSGHSQTHPPGGILFLWTVGRLINPGLHAAAFATILFAALTVIPVYLLARELYGTAAAVRSLLLFLVIPNMVMFSATSLDGPFALFPVLSIFLFFRAMRSQTILFSVLTGASLALGMLMNYTTVVLALFFGVLVLLQLRHTPNHLRRMCVVLFLAGVVFILLYVLLYLWSQFNLLDAVRASYRRDRFNVGTGYETPGRFFGISVANLIAFLIAVGVPLTVIWLREVFSQVRSRAKDAGADLFVLAGAVTLLGTAFSTLFTLETERIWIFMVPLLVIPAARRLHLIRQPRVVYAVVALLCLQLLVSELLLYTYW